MDSQQILQKIKQLVDTAQRVLITGQPEPDGDSLGSQLALYDILLQQKEHDGTAEGFEVVISNDLMPGDQYEFLPRLHRVVPWEDIRLQRFDLGFTLDAGTERAGNVLPMLKTCPHIVTIDHHHSRGQGIEQISWVEPEVCSVAEMLYDVFKHPAWQVDLTPDIAAGLYTGLIYDTGSFRYPKTTPWTLRIAAKLLETGIEFDKICEHVFLNKRFPGIRLFGEVLQNLQRDVTGEIIWGTITQDLLNHVQAGMEESEGLITQYAFTQGTKVAVLFKEDEPDTIKVSFRARGALDVGQFAKSLTTIGGGHPRAAGCTLHTTLHEAQQCVITRLQAALKQA